MPKQDLDTVYRATWLELFFDLVFVALIAQLTYLFSFQHSSFVDFLNVFLVGYMIFYAWWGTTVNRNLKDKEDVIDVLAIQFQMLFVMIMSLTLNGAFGDYSWLFFGSFGMNGLISLMLLRRMYRIHPHRRPNTLNIWWGFFIAACLWIVAGFLDGYFLYITAFSALSLQALAPMSTGKGNTKILLNMHHLLERMGLFLLLVMGEAVLVVALANTASEQFSAANFIIVICGLFQMIALWWLYFPYVEGRAKGKRARWFQTMFHAHGMLYGSLILTATGLKVLLKHPEAQIDEMFIFLMGIALMVGSFTVIQASLTRTLPRSIVASGSFFVAICLVIVAAHFLHWTALVTVPAVTFVLAAYVLADRLLHLRKGGRFKC